MKSPQTLPPPSQCVQWPSVPMWRGGCLVHVSERLETSLGLLGRVPYHRGSRSVRQCEAKTRLRLPMTRIFFFNILFLSKRCAASVPPPNPAQTMMISYSTRAASSAINLKHWLKVARAHLCKFGDDQQKKLCINVYQGQFDGQWGDTHPPNEILRGHSENDIENDSVSESQGNGREALGSMLIPRPSDAYTAYTRKVSIEFEKTRHDDVVVVRIERGIFPPFRFSPSIDYDNLIFWKYHQTLTDDPLSGFRP